ncbi:MAG TPA: CPBP family intramembrane glutamic endopeptidase [Caulobacteraceae bacterium]|jgi:membrane protease YdiL (CAAX protease family)|nr:CPBP family intramembrane glutamic endopeptidase [Caulobacteraceae bacterium]
MPDTAPSLLDYARRGRTRWYFWILTGLLTLVLALLLQIVVCVALTVALMRQTGVAAPTVLQHLMDLMQKPSDPISFFLFAGAMFGCYLVGLWLAALWLQGKRFGDLVGRWRWGTFAAGAGVWLALIAAGGLLDWVLDPKGFTVTFSPATASLALVAILGLPIQTFAEEFMFRGWIAQGWLLATKNPIATALLSGLMFGSVHLGNPPDGLISAAAASCFGIASTLIAIRLGGLAFSFGMHLVNNLWSAVVVVSSSDVFKGAPGIFSQHTSGLDWSDVGIEALCLALVTALVYVRTRPSLPKAG